MNISDIVVVRLVVRLDVLKLIGGFPEAGWTRRTKLIVISVNV